ncbi:MAG: hypothetical protein J6S75_04835, partial [Thermoguttaceae bacterium]|nr:hypothetical protein [Thermoguttaceae bacterium]
MKAANFCLSGFFALAAALFLTTASAEQGDMPVLPNGAAAVLTSVVQLPAELPASAFGAGDSRTYYVQVSDP